MRSMTIVAFALVTGLAAQANAQQSSQAQKIQNEADKGIKTENSGASGYVGEQDRAGSAARIPGSGRSDSDSAATAPSAQNSGTGIAGAPGNKNGPASQGTVGQNLSVQEQDTSNVKGLPGNKSGPPAKR